MKEIQEEAFIDLKAVINTLRAKWYYYLISIIFFLILGFVYIKTTPKVYWVKASIQLKDESLSDKGRQNEKFIKGLELVAGNSALDDEIGFLSSFKLIEEALQELDFTVSYYSYNANYGILGRKMEQELYKDAFQVRIDKTNAQPLGTPVYISFPDQDHYRIKVNTDNAYIFNLENNQLIQKDVPLTIDTTLAIDASYRSKALNFSLDLHPEFIFDEDKKYFFITNSLYSLAEGYAAQLQVAPITEESNIVSLSIKSRAPEKEKDLLNTIINLYIQKDLDKRNQLGLKALEFIDRQIATVYDSLSQDERKLESFRATNQIMNISTTSANLTEELQPLLQQQAQLQVQQRYFQNTLNSLKENDGTQEIIAPTAVGINDPYLSGLLTQLDELNREKTEKSYSSNTNNPVLKILEEKIKTTEATLVANIKNAIKSTQIALDENQRRINRINQQFSELPESERNLKNIERKFTLNDNTYNYLLEKRTEAGLALASNLPDKTIVDSARQIGNDPIAPNSFPILLMSLLAGLVVPSVLLFTQKHLHDNVTNKKELEETLNLPLIGTIPKFPGKSNVPVAKQPRGIVAEAFRFIRINLSKYQGTAEKNCKIIGVVSAQEGDGKTFCSVNMALSYARTGKSTIIIGADMRKPRLQEYFTVNEIGLANYLEGHASLSDLIIGTNYNNLYLLPSGSTKSEIGELIENNRLNDLFQELSQRFDVIIVDTPPLGPVADFHIFARHLNFKLFVVRQNHTSTTTLKAICDKLTRDEADNLFIVFNDINNFVMKEYGYSGKYEYSDS